MAERCRNGRSTVGGHNYENVVTTPALDPSVTVQHVDLQNSHSPFRRNDFNYVTNLGFVRWSERAEREGWVHGSGPQGGEVQWTRFGDG